MTKNIRGQGCGQGYVGARNMRGEWSMTITYLTFSLIMTNNINNNTVIKNIRGQGNVGRSNMRGEWNMLQALICKECPYAYYIYCFAHRLPLAVVVASLKVSVVHHFFFNNLTSIINIATSSSKCNDELKDAQAIDVAEKIVNKEV